MVPDRQGMIFCLALCCAAKVRVHRSGDPGRSVRGEDDAHEGSQGAPYADLRHGAHERADVAADARPR